MTQTRRIDDDTLSDYLVQHLLGSRSGVNMFRAAASTWKGTEHERALKDIAGQILEEQERLERLIHEVGGRVPVTARAVGVAARVGGRLNPVNALRSRRSGWTQVELDLLQGALQAKSGMWHVLAELAPHDPRIDESEMHELYDSAQRQQEEVRRIASAVLPEQFLRG
ncbi:hypothetical protein E4A47_03085 [Micrococcus flavus]|uniref:DUF892 family protein n=1 Tax=Micrococcus flavus TaxID=384602 RepID=A0A4Y8X3J3_9MICC|nr:hypothetical protein [Micrococcus flavus]MBB4882196.1 hypothetical protein [Micrococcus flavus]TFI03881.1 hypothetical protein E4A47_03085 [Micrococcus flavus]GGK50991.1 hypothetical protein GCM10007073_17690 [Micrococcus flavus]